MDVVWSDGHRSHYDFPYLRDECPCATCNDQHRKNAAAPVQTQPAIGSSVLPMFKAKIKARAAKSLGNYALQIEFNDGHSTGIYSYDYLRTICPARSARVIFVRWRAELDANDGLSVRMSVWLTCQSLVLKIPKWLERGLAPPPAAAVAQVRAHRSW
jgi:DUF971 family protein